MIRTFTVWTGIVMLAGSIGWYSSALANYQERESNFSLVATFDASESKMSFECRKGCTWERVSFGCSSTKRCSGSIDEFGTPAL